MRAHRSITGLVLGGLLALTLIVGVSAAPAAKASSQAARSVKVSASLSEPSFAPIEVNSVRVLYSFSGKSTSFSYRVSLQKRSGWQTIKSTTLHGRFRGSRSMVAGKLFRKRKAALGHYRLVLSAGASSTTIFFDVVKALATASSPVAAGDGHSCALIAGGKIKCWGDNSKGQLGNRTTTASITPVDVTSIKNVKAISTGGLNTCSLGLGGVVKCWGDNASG